MKLRVNYSIEKTVLKRLEEYLKKRKEILGGKISRSSIVESALAEKLIILDAELEQQKPDKKSISVAR